MHCIPSQKHPLAQTKAITDPLPNLIRGPPITVPVGDLVRPHDALRTLEDSLRVDLAAINLLAGPFVPLLRRRQLDVQPDELVLARDDHDGAVARRVDGAPHADVGEIRNGHNVEHAPDVVGALALQREAELAADPAVRAVGAEQVLCAHDLGLVSFGVEGRRQPQHLVAVVGRQVASEDAVLDPGPVGACRRLLGRRLRLAQVAQRDRDGVRVGMLGERLVEVEVGRHDAVLDGDLAAAVLADRVEEEALDAALVQHDLLEARDVGDRVGDAVATLDRARRVRVPQADLEHVVRLEPGAVAEIERVEDLERAALEAIGLAIEDLIGWGY